MADDANFCDGRLRLTAFLRVVENDMPQRPSRFKRRMPLVQDLPHEPTPTEPLSRQHSTGALDAHKNSQNCETSAKVPPKVHHGIDSNDPAGTAGQRKFTKAIKQARSNAPTSKAKESPGRIHKPLAIRKRWLPVNGLALLRTTTSDGLPGPSDAHKAFAVSITELDPIDDSQLVSVRKVLASNRHQPPRSQVNRDPAVKTIISSIGHEPQLRNSYPVKKYEPTFSKSRNPPIPMKHKQASGVYVQFVVDGFVGSELKSVLMRKPQRRRGVASRKPKPTIVVPGLALAGGLLPTPAAKHDNPSVVSQCMTTEPLDEPQMNLDSDPISFAKVPRQLCLARMQGVTNNRQAQHQQAERMERAVRSQLSSITAPIRRESESSGSDVITEGHSIIDDEEDHDDDIMEDVTHSHPSLLLSPRSTMVEDRRYFESAMYHLDLEDATENVDGGFWSLNNAME